MGLVSLKKGSCKNSWRAYKRGWIESQFTIIWIDVPDMSFPFKRQGAQEMFEEYKGYTHEPKAYGALKKEVNFN